MGNVLNLLSMARRAGQLELGMDPAKDAVRGRRCTLVCIASDLSDKSKKEILFVCSEANIELLELPESMDDFGSALGKRVGIIAVCDSGFAKAVRKRKTDYNK